MSKGDIEDVLSSIRRLVSEDLRPVPRAKADAGAGKLILTPALRVVEDDLAIQAEDLVSATAEVNLPPSEPVAEPALAADITHDLSSEGDATDANLSPPDDFHLNAVTEPQDAAEPTMEAGSDLQLILRRLAEQGLPGDEFLDFVESARPVSPPLQDPQYQRIEDLVAAVGSAVPDHGWVEDPEGDVAHATTEAWQSGEWADAPLPDDVVVYMDEVEEAEVLRTVTGQEQRLTTGWADSDAWEGATVTAPIVDAVDAADPDMAEAAARAAVDAANLADVAETAAAAATVAATGMFDADETGFDEEALRELVREIIREELQGSLGERITRNVRKLVRVEINRTLAAREFD